MLAPTSNLPTAILWDLDGTLIDQTGPILNCYRQVITDLGLPAPEDTIILRSMGQPLAGTMAMLVPESLQTEACERFRLIFPAMMFDGLIVLPSALKILSIAAKHAIPQAIFTNKHGPTARLIAEKLGFSQHIQACIGHTDTAWHKPDPVYTHYAFEQLDCSQPEAAVIIGDSPTDVAVGLNVGTPVIGITTGAHTADELLAAGAAQVHTSLSDLIPLWFD